MSQSPFMPLWVSDFIGDTQDLDAVEVGAYLMLLMSMWLKGGSLPDDEGKLKRVARCGREWSRVWASIKPYFTVEGGQIRNKRLSEELAKVNMKREVNSRNGARGGRAKALKENKPSVANATNSPQQPEPYSEPSTVSSGSNDPSKQKRAREAALSSEFDLFWEGWPNKVGKPKAFSAFKTARKSHSLQEIISGRDRYVRTKPPDRPWLNPATFLNQERFNDQPAEPDDAGKPKLRKWEGPDAESKTGPVFQGRADIREGEGSGRGGDMGEDRSRQRGMGEVVSLFDDDVRGATGGDGSGRERGQWERDYAGSVS